MGVSLTEEMIKGAQESEKKYGIPTSITLAQILQESGGSYSGGLSGLAYKAKNLFGMKGEGTAGSTYFPTTEYDSNGNAYKTNAKFASYNSFSDSIDAHGKLLTNSRYTKYTSNATTLEEYANGIAKGGYATDPNYASSLISQIKNNNLTQYDLGDWKTGGTYSSSSESSSSTTIAESSEDTKLKFWGDIVVLLLTVLVIGGSVLFFLKAFDVSLTPQGALLKAMQKDSKKSDTKEETKETKQKETKEDSKQKPKTKTKTKTKKGGK